MAFKVVACVVCVLGLARGQVVPPGMAEPLTKMAERMARVPKTGGVEGQLRARGGFLLRNNDAVTLHVAEPAKINAKNGKEILQLAQQVMDVQSQEMKALDSDSLQLNVIPPSEDAALTKARLEAFFKSEQAEADKAQEGFWNSVRHGNFIQATDAARVAKLVAGMGNDMGAASLEQLINAAGTPGAADTMRYSGALAKATNVLKSESASSYEKGLAGSLITLLTDMPVSAETSDVASGSNGHVTIVMPSPQRIYGK